MSGMLFMTSSQKNKVIHAIKIVAGEMQGRNESAFLLATHSTSGSFSVRTVPGMFIY